MPEAAAVCRVLVVDDAPDTLEVVRRNLQTAGFEVATASSVPEAIGQLAQAAADIVVTDVRMPAVSGIDLVRHVRENLAETAVVVITGYASIEGAVEAVKKGADEYLAKPFTDEELLAAVERARASLVLRRAGGAGLADISSVRHRLLGKSAAVMELIGAIERAARTSATVLVTGESGTGKELVARAIHYSGSRAAAPFVPVNCGGIPEGLLESALFGHLKGAFTGAGETRAGFFQTGDGGTLFLDELASTSVSMQAKLLRVLEDRAVVMVGDTRPHPVDVRIIGATNKDLERMVAAGDFRDDLYYRLNVLPISVPPLRERQEDIPLLVRHFAGRFVEENHLAAVDFTEDALRALQTYPWPGNVRELENVVQRLVVMAKRNPIDVPELPPGMRFILDGNGPLRCTLAELELDHIRRILSLVGGNKVKAAEILGIDRKTLQRKLKRSDGQA